MLCLQNVMIMVIIMDVMTMIMRLWFKMIMQ